MEELRRVAYSTTPPQGLVAGRWTRETREVSGGLMVRNESQSSEGPVLAQTARRLPSTPPKGPSRTHAAPRAKDAPQHAVPMPPTSKAPSDDAVLAHTTAPQRAPSATCIGRSDMPPQGKQRHPNEHVSALLNAYKDELLGGEARDESAASHKRPPPPPPPPPPRQPRGRARSRSRPRSPTLAAIPVGQRSSDMPGQPMRERPGHRDGPRTGTRGGNNRGLFAAKYGGGNHPTKGKGKGKDKAS